MNLIRNHDFSSGAKQPTGWEWRIFAGTPGWRFVPGRESSQSRGLELRSTDAESAGGFIRAVRVRGSQHYRVEATVRVNCRSTVRTGGLALDVCARKGAQVVDESPACGFAAENHGWVICRRYYQVPRDATHLELCVVLRNAIGRAVVDSVRVIPIDEPEACSHILAVPPPPYAYPPRRKAHRAVIVGDSAGARQLAAILGLRLGERHVEINAPRAGLEAAAGADAVIFPSTDRLPPHMTLSQLHRLAGRSVVIVGLEAFARLSGLDGLRKPAGTRLIEQSLNPTHARVTFANFITRGFALNDTFPYWWDADSAGVYTQRILRNSPVLKRFCRKHDYQTILLNEGETDATSGHPLCLYHPTDGGGVVVLDTEPIVTQSTSEFESGLPVHVLFNILGWPQHALGQFTVPQRRAQDLAEELDQLGRRFPPARVHRLANGADEVGRWIELSAAPETFGLPVAVPPVILIRTGLAPSDWDGVYGALVWVKNLFRPPPFAAPYTRALLASRRIAWLPVTRADHSASSRAAGQSREVQMPGDLEPGSLAATLDIVTTAEHPARLVVPERSGAYRKYECPLRALMARLLKGRHLHFGAGMAASPVGLNGTGFRLDQPEIEMTADARAFTSAFHRAARGAGAECLRLELPGDPNAGPTQSIRLTDRVALCIEWLIGLQVGLLAVNRDAERLGLRVPIHDPDHMHGRILNGNGTVEQPRICAPGDSRTIEATLEPGAALVITRTLDSRSHSTLDTQKR